MDIPDTSSTILVIAIVQAQDAVNASDGLKHINAAAFQLPSMGGFFRFTEYNFIDPVNVPDTEYCHPGPEKILQTMHRIYSRPC